MSMDSLDVKALYMARKPDAVTDIKKPENTRDPEELREAARSFEAIFLRQLFTQMYKANDQLTENKLADGIYRDMFINNVADIAAKHDSIGIARILERQWGIEQKESTSPEDLAWRKTLSTLDGVSPHDRAQLRQWRVPVDGAISSEYGMRVHPISGETRMHHGVDIAAPEGTPIHPVAPGRVVFAGERGGYGLTIDIEHPGGLLTRYAHAHAIHVQEGDRVSPKDHIADVGQTGSATGPHLHFEMRRDNQSIDPQAVVTRLRTGTK